MHGVVPGVEEDPAPQVGDAVGVALLDPDQAAALADAGQVRLADAVPDAPGEHGQDGQGEERLQGAGGREPAVRVVRGQHLAGAGVGHQPRQGGDVRDLGCSAVWPDLGVGAVQERG